MSRKPFGGPWTEEKLAVLEKYLIAHRNIFLGNPKARFYKVTYVDAFAGPGFRAASRADRAYDPDARDFMMGSAVRALSLEQPFDRYHFIDKDAGALAQLAQHVPGHLSERVTLDPGDANARLKHLCRATRWQTRRAVIFLDPYGLQLTWDTLEAIAATKAADLWLLFPVSMGVNRLLTKGGLPPEDWSERLDLTFGTAEWRERFYERGGLFPDHPVITKQATLDGIAAFMLERLDSIFTHVCRSYLVLKNSLSAPLFILLFAAAAEVGGDTAVRIARDIIIKQLGRSSTSR